MPVHVSGAAGCRSVVSGVRGAEVPHVHGALTSLPTRRRFERCAILFRAGLGAIFSNAPLILITHTYYIYICQYSLACIIFSVENHVIRAFLFPNINIYICIKIFLPNYGKKWSPLLPNSDVKL